jgi:hypothetical protein
MTAKDSATVVSFMARFARLKTFVDDDPTDLVSDAIRDESVRDLCAALAWDSFFLEIAERNDRELFSIGVDPSFIAAWRDYQKRYDGPVGWVSGCVLFSTFGGDEEDLVAQLASGRPRPPTVLERWANANAEAAEAVGKIAKAVTFAKDQIEEEDRWDDDQEDWVQDITDGVRAWSLLEHQTGIDLRGMLRRRALVPFVLIPRKIANQQGSKDRTALLRNLKEAQDAYVRGTLVASVVLLRATVEVALKEHYKTFGDDLKKRIESARGKLPFGVTVRELHELRELANDFLHEPSLLGNGGLGAEGAENEIRVAALLVTVRALIEGVK